MKSKYSKNNNFFKKILTKIIRKLGYEFVDQSNLTLSNKDLYIKDNLSEAGKKSLTLPMGETKISRKGESKELMTH